MTNKAKINDFGCNFFLFLISEHGNGIISTSEKVSPVITILPKNLIIFKWYELNFGDNRVISPRKGSFLVFFFVLDFMFYCLDALVILFIKVLPMFFWNSHFFIFDDCIENIQFLRGKIILIPFVI